VTYPIKLDLEDVNAIFSAFNVSHGEGQGTERDDALIARLRALVGDALPETECEAMERYRREERKKNQ
jgi:hypothetical protein